MQSSPSEKPELHSLRRVIECWRSAIASLDDMSDASELRSAIEATEDDVERFRSAAMDRAWTEADQLELDELTSLHGELVARIGSEMTEIESRRNELPKRKRTMRAYGSTATTGQFVVGDA